MNEKEKNENLEVLKNAVAKSTDTTPTELDEYLETMEDPTVFADYLNLMLDDMTEDTIKKMKEKGLFQRKTKTIENVTKFLIKTSMLTHEATMRETLDEYNKELDLHRETIESLHKKYVISSTLALMLTVLLVTGAALIFL